MDIDKELQAFAYLHLEPLQISDSNTGITITMSQLYECARYFYAAGIKEGKEKLPKWKRYSNNSCWSGEIGVKPTQRKFTYEHYAINADKLFRLLDKED